MIFLFPRWDMLIPWRVYTRWFNSWPFTSSPFSIGGQNSNHFSSGRPEIHRDPKKGANPQNGRVFCCRDSLKNINSRGFIYPFIRSGSTLAHKQCADSEHTTYRTDLASFRPSKRHQLAGQDGESFMNAPRVRGPWQEPESLVKLFWGSEVMNFHDPKLVGKMPWTRDRHPNDAKGTKFGPFDFFITRDLRTELFFC